MFRKGVRIAYKDKNKSMWELWDGNKTKQKKQKEYGLKMKPGKSHINKIVQECKKKKKRIVEV